MSLHLIFMMEILIPAQSPSNQNPLIRSGTIEGQWRGLGPTCVFTPAVIRLIAPTCGSLANMNKNTSHPGIVLHRWHPRVLIIVGIEEIWCWAGTKPLPYEIMRKTHSVLLCNLEDLFKSGGRQTLLLKNCHSIFDIWCIFLNIYLFILTPQIYWNSVW